MKIILKPLAFILAIACVAGSCKKSNNSNSGSNSPLVGFWTFKEDPAVDYWNQNVLFRSDGTFRAYTALSLADTSAAAALADTVDQVKTFGTYTVNGVNVQMIYSEFTTIGLKFTGSLNSSKNILIGNVETNDTTSAPLFYLTKP
jgi:hypothetical protein